MNKAAFTLMLLITILLLWSCKPTKTANVTVNGEKVGTGIYEVNGSRNISINGGIVSINGKKVDLENDASVNGSRVISINSGTVKINGKKVDIDNDAFIKGSGKFETESRQIKSFDKIQLNLSAEITVVFKDEPSLTITAEDNILPAVKTEISDQKLKIFSSENFIQYKKIKIEIAVSNLSMAEIKGSGNIRIVDLKTDKFKSMINGSGEINISGAINELSSIINGSGDIISKDLLTKSHTATISGSGKIYTYTSDYLNINIKGSGDLIYKGKPQINSSVQGSGKIVKMD